MPDPVLEVVGLRKRFGKTVALDGVALAVFEGEMFGLLGPNGAGKTTLISILCGLAAANEGIAISAGDERVRERPAGDHRELRAFGVDEDRGEGDRGGVRHA